MRDWQTLLVSENDTLLFSMAVTSSGLNFTHVNLAETGSAILFFAEVQPDFGVGVPTNVGVCACSPFVWRLNGEFVADQVPLSVNRLDHYMSHRFRIPARGILESFRHA